MKKRITGLFILSIILLVIILLNIKVNKKLTNKGNIADRIQFLKYFEFTNLNNEIYSQKKLNEDFPFIIIWFDPLCDHCTYETEDIIKNIDLFKDISILLVSNADKELLKEFSQKYSLDTIEEIEVLRSDYVYFAAKFNKPARAT